MSLSQVLRESEMDEFLTGNPQITYFKSVYRRHTPFYKGVHTYQEHKPLEESKVNESLSYGSYDLITNIFLENKIEQAEGTTYANLGNNIVEDIIFKVGQTELYHTYGLYMETRAELDHPYVPSCNASGTSPPTLVNVSPTFKCNTGSQYNVQTMAGGVTGHDAVTTTDTFYTFPNFYFCREYGSAFPICALNNSEVVLEINYRSSEDISSSNITSASYTSTVNVEYVDLSDDERMRFINNTDIYYYYDVIQHHLGKTEKGISYPLRQIFLVGKHDSTGSTITSKSTPVSLTAARSSAVLTDVDIKVNSDPLYDDTTDISIFTKQNLNRLYPGYGRELGFNRIKVTIHAAYASDHAVGSIVTQTSATGILAEAYSKTSSTNTTIFVIVTSNSPFTSTTTATTINSISANATAITHEPLGYNDSIGVHSFCLDTTNTPSGHLSANVPFSINLTATDKTKIQTYLEVIKFYKIMGGQLGPQYI
tara:strand:+ start:69 stop:1511 length:1443 start_codon:yes stop_codon:yes gene_type:complete